MHSSPSTPRSAEAGRAAASAVLLLGLLAGGARAQTFTYSEVARFDVSTGAGTLDSLILDGSGNLYGTASVGGTDGFGTVYKIAAGTNAITAVHSFVAGEEGAFPSTSPTFGPDGLLYGVAQFGTFSDGVLYKVDTVTGALTTIASFEGPNGANPASTLLFDGAGNLYGTTLTGLGPTDQGTLWEVEHGTTTIKTLASFDPDVTGFDPFGHLAFDSAGNIYGATTGGGPGGAGTVFKWDAVSGELSAIGSFDGTNGDSPFGVTIDSSGNVYGATSAGGATGQGTVFRIPAGTGGVQTLASLDPTIGDFPQSGVVVDAQGNLFGTTRLGGANNHGTVYEIVAGTGELRTIYDFDAAVSGYDAIGGLLIDSLGNLYGTTTLGPGGLDEGAGLVFKLTRADAGGGGGGGPEPLPGEVPEPGAVASGLTMFGATGIGLLRGALARRRRRCCPALA